MIFSVGHVAVLAARELALCERDIGERNGDALVQRTQAILSMIATVDRDATFFEQAVAAGAFDTLTRTQELGRLQDAGRRVDTAVRTCVRPRAAWLRRITSSP